ncbi:unnamed protein product [Gongylonema pulchrum]|uniref:ABC transmembrane type-1 domain-containing protein n=1 Tax=Gongylonema pulchrum TaxID=637853 RepID=A0A183DPA4_9BILA|nr:unnamed protein product [Gongylonema pulchrum]
MVFGLLSHATSVLIGALYPAFKTFKVIRDGHYNEMFVAPLLTSYEHDIDDMLDNMRYSVQRRFSALGNGALDR